MKVCSLHADAQNVASDVANDIKHICKSIDKRFSGSQGERDAADHLAQKLSAATDDVRIQPFKVYPRAYFGWIAFTVACTLLAFAAYFFSTMVSILLVLVGVIPYYFEYVGFKRLYDPLFEQKESQNVYAVKHCSGEVKRRIVLVAHYDAGYEWHTKYVFGTALFVTQRVLNILGIVYLTAIDIARWALVGGIGAGVADGVMLYLGLAGIFFVLPWSANFFFISRRRIIDSANDGLSGALTAVHVFDTIKDVQFENTEVCVLLVGSSAVGMRGAMAFADANKGQFGEETIFVVANILREKQYLRVNTHELNCMVKSDKDVARLAVTAANDVGLPCHGHLPLFSNSESGIFSRAGWRSVGVNALNRHMPDYYRTRYDSFDNLSEDCIAAGYQFELDLISRYGGEYRFELVGDAAKGEDDAPSDGPQPQAEDAPPSSEAQ